MTGSDKSAWAVFDGTNRVAGATTTTGTFTVDLGKTYNIFAVDGASPYSSVTTSVSPAAPSIVPTISLDETMPPVTTSDAVASYTGTATIHLTASDGAGRGVAYVYYRLDDSFVHLFTVGMIAETSVKVPAPLVGTGTHTLLFWSQDAAGNVEARKSVTFTVAAPVVTPPNDVATHLVLSASARSVRVGKYVTFSSILSGGVPLGTHVRYQVRTPGHSTYVTISSTRGVSATGVSSIRYKLSKRGTYYVRARFMGIAGFSGSISNVVKVAVK
jgi:hypothetical protein